MKFIKEYLSIKRQVGRINNKTLPHQKRCIYLFKISTYLIKAPPKISTQCDEKAMTLIHQKR